MSNEITIEEKAVLRLMTTNGSNFTIALAAAYRAGSLAERKTIVRAFPDLWKGYELMAKDGRRAA